MDVKEIALRVAEKYRTPQGHIQMSAYVFIKEVEALIAEIQKQNEPVGEMRKFEREGYGMNTPEIVARTVEKYANTIASVKGTE